MGSSAISVVSVKPREKSGARTAARYAFQVHVSLEKLLNLYQSGADFRAVIDYFDDLTIFDADEMPTSAEFFQIKGKATGKWTSVSLSKEEPEAPKTIVGKMYYNSQNFGAATKACVFVTNAHFDFQLADGTKTTVDHEEIEYGELGTIDKARFSTALTLDFAPPRNPDEAAVIRFERTKVPLTGYDTFLKGRIVDIVANMPGATVAAVYRTLIETISTKGNDTTECKSLADVFDHKSIGRTDFEATFKAAEEHESILDHWVVVEQELANAGRTPVARIRTKTATIQYLRDRAKRTSDTSILTKAIDGAVAEIMTTLITLDSLLAAAALIQQHLDANLVASAEPSKLEAALLTAAYEVLNG
ncbi:dsDNA nuclease domain-containing protein [Mesorhizobium sp. WSM4976]|uniref:dsDNA nuclease domain-containing protein n=1 Tax=Mesorhizobium sp. WSM4976 TaxID=3038549 RepID=UPI002415DA72|nr:dsDNA nuclease domain-containing protein [Mesorhizobium sp. WSM4976]MDG4896482.1 dsDNA nuclease domain-containing protein [Mesorhizobium sp. WSM4976]